MRKTPLATVAGLALALTFALAGCSGTASDNSPSTSSSSSSTDQGATSPEKTGTFAGLNEKNVSGTVTVTDSAIKLADFSSDEGPDLHIYLTTGTDEAAVAAGTEIDAVAFDEASQTFTLDGVDVSGFTNVVIHCDKAKAVFGAAKLS